MKIYVGYVYGLFQGPECAQAYDSIAYGPCESQEKFDKEILDAFMEEHSDIKFIIVQHRSVEINGVVGQDMDGDAAFLMGGAAF